MLKLIAFAVLLGLASCKDGNGDSPCAGKTDETPRIHDFSDEPQWYIDQNPLERGNEKPNQNFPPILMRFEEQPFIVGAPGNDVIDYIGDKGLDYCRDVCATYYRCSYVVYLSNDNGGQSCYFYDDLPSEDQNKFYHFNVADLNGAFDRLPALVYRKEIQACTWYDLYYMTIAESEGKDYKENDCYKHSDKTNGCFWVAATNWKGQQSDRDYKPDIHHAYHCAEYCKWYDLSHRNKPDYCYGFTLKKNGIQAGGADRDSNGNIDFDENEIKGCKLQRRFRAEKKKDNIHREERGRIYSIVCIEDFRDNEKRDYEDVCFPRGTKTDGECNFDWVIAPFTNPAYPDPEPFPAWDSYQPNRS